MLHPTRVTRSITATRTKSAPTKVRSRVPAAPKVEAAIPAAPFSHIQPHQVTALQEWVRAHPDALCPTREQKNALIVSENLKEVQIVNWFNNNKSKILKIKGEPAAPTAAAAKGAVIPSSHIQPHQQA